MLVQTSFPCIIFHQLKSFQSLNEHFPANTPVGGSSKSSFSPPYGIDRVEKKKGRQQGCLREQKVAIFGPVHRPRSSHRHPRQRKKALYVPADNPVGGTEILASSGACLRQASETFWTITELTFRKKKTPEKDLRLFFF
jgi:hypothetical protein